MLAPTPPPPSDVYRPWAQLWLGKQRERFCLVDECELDWINAHRWTTIWHKANKYKEHRDYVRRNTGPDRATLYLHRELMKRWEPPPGLLWEITHVVDHINGNPLDNRRANLRWLTKAENSLNTRRHRRIMTLEEIMAANPVPPEYQIPF